MGEIWRFSKYYFRRSAGGADAGRHPSGRNAAGVLQPYGSKALPHGRWSGNRLFLLETRKLAGIQGNENDTNYLKILQKSFT